VEAAGAEQDRQIPPIGIPQDLRWIPIGGTFWVSTYPRGVDEELVMTTDADGHVHGYTAEKSSHLKRLRRIEGQIRGLQRMVEEDKYCIDILTQVSAATKALQSFSLELLDEHLEHCVVDAARRGGEEADQKVREASEAIARLVRS
jgi:DNA-binding FrmR family transcriptional regulator